MKARRLQQYSFFVILAPIFSMPICFAVTCGKDYTVEPKKSEKKRMSKDFMMAEDTRQKVSGFRQ